MESSKQMRNTAGPMECEPHPVASSVLKPAFPASPEETGSLIRSLRRGHTLFRTARRGFIARDAPLETSESRAFAIGVGASIHLGAGLKQNLQDFNRVLWSFLAIIFEAVCA